MLRLKRIIKRITEGKGTDMTRDDAKEYVNKQEPKFLAPAKTKANGKQTYVCPICKNGTGTTGDGLAWNPKNGRWKCFACGLHEDVVGLWKIHQGLADNKEIFDTLYEYYGVNLDNKGAGSKMPKTKQPSAPSEAASLSLSASTEDKPKKDQTEYFADCRSRLSQTDYLERRGIDQAIAARFNIGYDPACKEFGGKPALIIPTSKYSYVARNTDPDTSDRYRKGKGCPVRIFNAEALKGANSPLFVVEGELDALAIMTAGGDAVALGNLDIKKLLDILEPSAPLSLILALDNDDAGIRATDELAEGLTERHISYYRPKVSELYNGYKDANEALLASADDFRQSVANAVQDAGELKNEAYAAYISTRADVRFNTFWKDTDFEPISTGFPALDKELSGGITNSLYLLGAVPSLGKTTLALQIADNIAQTGQDVLIFSLEMAATELMAKSVSRESYVLDKKHAFQLEDLLTPSKRNAWNQEERERYEAAVKKYRAYAKHIFIQEGEGKFSYNEIIDTVNKHKRFRRRYPVVIVDYLQILTPANEYGTDKQNIDKSVLELKRLSRQMPVIAISAFNRDNYDNIVSLKAALGSGGIEYGADVVLGLQFTGMGQSGVTVETKKEEQGKQRSVEIVVLKNRRGRTHEHIVFEYHTCYNYFTVNPVKAKKK